MALIAQCRLSLTLYFRQRIAMIYGYAFPSLFLVAFWVLYRQQQIPLAAHMGQLLTITVLGGSCFGFATTLVGERELGVWRRYRLTPAPLSIPIAGTALARFLVLITAVALQLLLAATLGTPAPRHPWLLLAVFSLVSYAFLGLGLLIAAMADSVPAVQALGQCLFLPMLILGGVAVPLDALPAWAQHVAAFLPGRYAVDALQATAQSGPLVLADVAAIFVIGTCAWAAGTRLFRWDAGQRFASVRGKRWLLLVLAAWFCTGLLAEARGLVVRGVGTAESWRLVALDSIDGQIDFDALPPDSGIVTPVASVDEVPPADVINQLNRLRIELDSWTPAAVADPLQRVRNDLYVAAAVDVLQQPMERYVPQLIFERLKTQYPGPELTRIYFWIATHPDDGGDDAVARLVALNIDAAGLDRRAVRARAAIYAVKALARLRGSATGG